MRDDIAITFNGHPIKSAVELGAAIEKEIAGGLQPIADVLARWVAVMKKE